LVRYIQISVLILIRISAKNAYEASGPSEFQGTSLYDDDVNQQGTLRLFKHIELTVWWRHVWIMDVRHERRHVSGWRGHSGHHRLHGILHHVINNKSLSTDKGKLPGRDNRMAGKRRRTELVQQLERLVQQDRSSPRKAEGGLARVDHGVGCGETAAVAGRAAKGTAPCIACRCTASWRLPDRVY
jgi:hypothetical protein